MMQCHCIEGIALSLEYIFQYTSFYMHALLRGSWKCMHPGMQATWNACSRPLPPSLYGQREVYSYPLLSSPQFQATIYIRLCLLYILCLPLCILCLHCASCAFVHTYIRASVHPCILCIRASVHPCIMAKNWHIPLTPAVPPDAPPERNHCMDERWPQSQQYAAVHQHSSTGGFHRTWNEWLTSWTARVHRFGLHVRLQKQTKPQTTSADKALPRTKESSNNWRWNRAMRFRVRFAVLVVKRSTSRQHC